MFCRNTCILIIRFFNFVRVMSNWRHGKIRIYVGLILVRDLLLCIVTLLFYNNMEMYNIFLSISRRRHFAVDCFFFKNITEVHSVLPLICAQGKISEFFKICT